MSVSINEGLTASRHLLVHIPAKQSLWCAVKVTLLRQKHLELFLFYIQVMQTVMSVVFTALQV